MANNIKQITRIPLSVRAKTPEELSIACLENNLKYETEFHYFQIMKEGKEWIAWFYAELEKYPILKRTNIK
jgi:excinuclease UvrABC nuclease subunit